MKAPGRRVAQPAQAGETPEWSIDPLGWPADEPEIVLYDARGRVVTDEAERARPEGHDDQRRRDLQSWLGVVVLALVALGIVIVVGVTPRGRSPEPLIITAPVVDHVAEARDAMAAERWALAAEHLRAALVKDPDSLFLHYNLGTAASWLDVRDEAIREFEWVVANGPAASEEMSIAQLWLAQNRDTAPNAGESVTAPKPGSAVIRGVATWADAGSEPKPLNRGQLFLIGLRDAPTAREYRVLRSDREGRFDFRNVVPGPYKLTDAIAGQPKWRLKVIVEPDQELALDLTPENGTQKQDDFPDGG